MWKQMRQKLHSAHLGRLCRRGVTLSLAVSMLLPSVAYGFDGDLERPTEMVAGEEPTIIIEANAVVNRWYDPALGDPSDYLTGEFEVAIRVRSGEKDGEAQLFNTLSVALKYDANILTPCRWTSKWDGTYGDTDREMNLDAVLANEIYEEDCMVSMQTLKNNKISTASAHVCETVQVVETEETADGYVSIRLDSDRPVELKNDKRDGDMFKDEQGTVLGVISFKYDADATKILAKDAAQWLSTNTATVTPAPEADGDEGDAPAPAARPLIQFATPAELKNHYSPVELFYYSETNDMFYSSDANNAPLTGDLNRLTLNTETYTEKDVKAHQINFVLTNKTTYNDGGLSLDDLATVLFYDWDDTLIGVLIVPRDGDARKLVNDYVRDHMIHPDLREADVDSLARKDNYRGKYPTTPMPEADGIGDPSIDLEGEMYPLTNKLDYVFLKRPMEKVTTDVNGDPITTNTWRQKGATGETLENEEWDELYAFTHGWARLTDKNWNKPSSMWTTIGVGELVTYTSVVSGAYPEDLKTGVITVNQYGSELTATDSDFNLETFDFRNHPLPAGGVCSVKAVYEPGDHLLNGGYSYQMISEPYYNKMNYPEAESGAAYSVDVVYERTNMGVAKNLNGIARARQLELRQETTTDLRWDNEYLQNADIKTQRGRTKTTYSTVPIDNVDVVNIQLVLSGRQNKVDYFLVEANNASFVTGGTRSDTNITRLSTAHLIDNYNYKTTDNDTDRVYYQAEYVDTDGDGKVDDDRSGSYGFVLFGTINNLAKQALARVDETITNSTFNDYLSLPNFNDMNLRVDGVLEDGKWIGGKPVSSETRSAVRNAWQAAVRAARTAHEGGNDEWWNVEQDLPQFTYHQIQLYVNDYVKNNSATLRDADAADKQTIAWCNLHEECASARTGKPNSLAKMVQAALKGEKDKLLLLTLDEAENLAHIRANERGTAYSSISALSDALIAAVQGINAIKPWPGTITDVSEEEWDAIQGWILSNPKPTPSTGLDDAIDLSRNTAWWNKGESAPATGSLAALVAAEKKAVETGRDAWINYYRYQDAFTDMKTNGVSPTSQWTRLTENLVKNINGEPFDTYDQFKTAFRKAVEVTGLDLTAWGDIQYAILHNYTAPTHSAEGEEATEDEKEIAKYWWHNGYSRVTDLPSLFVAAQQAATDDTIWEMFDCAALYSLQDLRFRSTFNGTTGIYTDVSDDDFADFDDFKSAVLRFIDEPGAIIAKSSDNAQQRLNSWNQLQYYLIHKDDEFDYNDDGVKETIDLTQRATTVAIQLENPYYWWRNGGTGTPYAISAGAGDYNITTLMEAVYRATFNGNPHALDNLDEGAAASFRLIPAYVGTEETWNDLTKYVADDPNDPAPVQAGAISELKSKLKDLAEKAGETVCRDLTWRQLQHYLLGKGYVTAGDSNMPTDAPFQKDEAGQPPNYWWRQGDANPNLVADIKNDLETFLDIIDQFAAGTYEGDFYTAADLYSGATEGEGTRLNLYGGWSSEPVPISYDFMAMMDFESSMENIATTLSMDETPTPAADVLDWFVLQYYALTDNAPYWAGDPIISKAAAKSYYLQLLSDLADAGSELTNWAPSYVDISTTAEMEPELLPEEILLPGEVMLPAELIPVEVEAPELTTREKIETLTREIAALADAIRENPELATEYAQEIGRLMELLEELKALLIVEPDDTTPVEPDDPGGLTDTASSEDSAPVGDGVPTVPSDDDDPVEDGVPTVPSDDDAPVGDGVPTVPSDDDTPVGDSVPTVPSDDDASVGDDIPTVPSDDPNEPTNTTPVEPDDPGRLDSDAPEADTPPLTAWVRPDLSAPLTTTVLRRLTSGEKQQLITIENTSVYNNRLLLSRAGPPLRSPISSRISFAFIDLTTERRMAV